MQSSEVRRSFLQFFAGRGHQVVPSSPLVLPADPTLLFANAGMNQFKEVFRGHEQRPYTRAASSQKCLRVSGKHNDLEEVGRTPRHHTFFEMLGNFSFGDYFKRDAIAWGWELVTDVWKLPPERLWVTVFEGDAQFPADEEAARFWDEIAGVPRARILALGRKDNFWQMGDTGPAGPCTEIHVDMNPGGPAGEHPGNAPARFLEIWNLVFMQFDLQADGGAKKLPAPSVDTGAGLERLTAVLSGAPSNYDTDLFLPILRPLADEAKHTYRPYGDGGDKDVSLRVIADHLRAIVMLVSEGIIPGPEKRGAVLRRILRRALRHGRLLDLPVPFLHRHLRSVVELLGPAFPELPGALPLVEKIVRREEERFEKTLADGFERLEERISELAANGETVFPGAEAFVLESERGLPLDLVRDALEERRMTLAEGGYEAARRQHVAASRATGGAAHAVAPAAGVLLDWKDRPSCFVGRDTLQVPAARITGILKDGAPVPRLGPGDKGQVLLDETPFYAESGGQVGDRGTLRTGDGRALVTDVTAPLPGVVLHDVTVEQGALVKGEAVVAEVDARWRASAKRHHTATHLLHAALRRVLGPHVQQRGSLVTPERLRFDFAHYEGVDAEAMRDIEDLVNETIVQDVDVETREVPLEQALAEGALAFFGDRYGDRVRVVRVGDFSMELCGGTHVARTGEIGPALIWGERGVAAGVRRLEAVCGPVAVRWAREGIDALEQVAGKVGVAAPAVLEGVDRRLEALRALQKENEQLKLKLARGEAGAAPATVDVDGVAVLARRADGLSKGQRRDLADSLRQQNPGAVVILAAEDEGKAAVLVAVGEKVRARVDARAAIQKLGPLVGGGGGGRPDLAEAGGKNPGGIDAALQAAPEIVRALLT